MKEASAMEVSLLGKVFVLDQLEKSIYKRAIKEAAEEAEKLVREFITATLQK